MELLKQGSQDLCETRTTEKQQCQRPANEGIIERTALKRARDEGLDNASTYAE